MFKDLAILIGTIAAAVGVVASLVCDRWLLAIISAWALVAMAVVDGRVTAAMRPGGRG